MGVLTAQRAALEVSEISFGYGGRSIFDRLSFGVAMGESLAIQGPSGVGKSTLLSIILGLLRPASGSVMVAGQDVSRLRGRALARYRAQQIGVVFQSGELFPHLSAVENVVLPAAWSRQRRADPARAADLLAAVGVDSEAPDAASLSGGERQRTAVARALMNEPALILADEPTGSLDGDAEGQVADLLFDLPRSRPCALVVVTHSDRVAARADDRLVLTRAVR